MAVADRRYKQMIVTFDSYRLYLQAETGCPYRTTGLYSCLFLLLLSAAGASGAASAAAALFPLASHTAQGEDDQQDDACQQKDIKNLHISFLSRNGP